MVNLGSGCLFSLGLCCPWFIVFPTGIQSFEFVLQLLLQLLAWQIRFPRLSLSVPLWSLVCLCLFLCLHKPRLNNVDHGFGTMDLAGVSFHDGAANADDALNASPRRNKQRRG